MGYTKQIWVDGSSSSPLSAARLNYLENGVVGASQAAELADAKAEGAPARVAGSRAASLQVNDDYSQFPSGPISATQTGMPYSLYASGSGGTAWLPRIVDGFLTSDPNFNLGSYAQVGPFPARINRVGARWKFSAQSNGGGVMCIALMETNFIAQHSTGGGVARSPLHLLITPETMSLTAFPVSGGEPVDAGLGVVTFDTPLATDDNTLHTVDCVIDTANGVIYIDGPDGRVRTITNAIFKDVPAYYAYNEPYRTDGAPAGKTLVKFRNFWVGTTSEPLIPALRGRVAHQDPYIPLPEAANAFPGSSSTITVGTSATVVPGTQVTFTVPGSGSVLLALSATIDVTADGPVHLGVVDESSSVVALRTVATKISHSGQVTVLIPFAATPGATRTVGMCVMRAAGAATLLLGQSGSGGTQVYASATLAVLPTG